MPRLSFTDHSTNDGELVVDVVVLTYGPKYPLPWSPVPALPSCRSTDLSPSRRLAGRPIDPLHRADADAQLLGDGLDALAGAPQLAHAPLQVRPDAGTAEFLPLGPGAGEAGVDPLADHRPLVLGEDAHHAVHGPPRGGGGVEP